MKKLLIITSSLILSSSAVTSLVTNINNYQTIDKLNINNSINWIDIQDYNNNYFKNDKEDDINKLDMLYKKRSTDLNQKIKNNLISCITLDKNKININYKNLNKDLFEDTTYKFLQSKDYWKYLEMQYQMHQIKFSINKHIIFVDEIHFLKFSGVWFESHWYWFGYWRLHLDSNRCHQLINMIDNATRAASGVTAVAVLSSLISNWEIGVFAAALAAFVIGIQWTLISYDHGRGVWFAAWTFIPMNVGSN